jgi:hypothetical protein
VHDERVTGRAALDGEHRGHGGRIGGVGPQPVDGLGGEGHQPAGPQGGGGRAHGTLVGGVDGELVQARHATG